MGYVCEQCHSPGGETARCRTLPSARPTATYEVVLGEAEACESKSIPVPLPSLWCSPAGNRSQIHSAFGSRCLELCPGGGEAARAPRGGTVAKGGKEPCIFVWKERKGFLIWPCTGAADEFGQPLGPRRRQRGASRQSRAAGDVAVRCPERPSLPAAKSRMWKGAELLLTGRWRAVLLWEQPLLGCSHTKNAEAPSVVDGERKLGGTLRS